ncbi:MAG: HPP family protein [Gemmatimonadales bacterium]
MKVADIMQPKVITVSLETRLADAVVTLADSHISGLPVVDRHGVLVGVLSTSDVLAALAEGTTAHARSRDLLYDTSVGDVMTARPQTVPPDEDVREAAQVMLYLGVHRLFVEEDKELVGVISQSDIVRAVAQGEKVG